MEAKTIEFLKNLQQELNTQETDCQANPRFWVVAQYEWHPCWEDQADKVVIYSPDHEMEFDSFESIMDYLIEEDYLEKEMCEDISDLEDLNEYVVAYEVPQKKVHVIKRDTMFLTKRECQEHIQRNNYHYNDTVHTFALTAWRSPQVEKLIEILQTENFDEVK